MVQMVQMVQIVNETWAREYKGGQKGLANTLNPRAGNQGCLPSRRDAGFCRSDGFQGADEGVDTLALLLRKAVTWLLRCTVPQASHT
jgi:hypothetical protein